MYDPEPAEIIREIRKQIDTYIEEKVEREVQKHIQPDKEDLDKIASTVQEEFSLERGGELDQEEVENFREIPQQNSVDEDEARTVNMIDGSEIRTVNMLKQENQAKYGLRDSSLAVMAACQIHDEDPDLRDNPSFKDIRKKSGYVDGTISQAYHQLETNGWIERGQKPKGRRRPITFLRKLEHPEKIINEYHGDKDL